MANDEAGRPRGESRPEQKAPAAKHETVSPGRVDYRCADLRGCDMGGISLEHADFRAAELQGVNFSGSNLRDADFRGANVVGANFQNASLYGAKMQGVVAFHADFRHSDLRHADFRGAYLDKTMMPPLSPSEIAAGPRQQEKPWREELAESRKDGQDGNTGNDQNGQARGRSLPDEQRGRGRGR
jgi:hypothetical protein